MNRFMLTVTVATTVLMGIANAQAQQTYTYYTPAGMTVQKPMTLGQMIAMRMEGNDTANFEQAIARADLQNVDIQKGYTVFAVVDDAFKSNDPNAVKSYVVNDRVSLNAMAGKSNTAKSITGNTLRINRVGDSYFVNDMRVNDVVRNHEGLIYTIGGHNTAYAVGSAHR